MTRMEFLIAGLLCACVGVVSANALQSAASQRGAIPVGRASSVGTVKLTVVFDRLDETRDNQMKLEEANRGFNEELKALEKEMAAASAREQALPEGAEKSKALSDLQQQAAKVQALRDKRTRDLGRMQLEMTAKSYHRIVHAAEQLRQSKNLDLLITTDDEPDPAKITTIPVFLTAVSMRKVLTSGLDLDVTSLLIRQMNEAYLTETK